ncbi:hypothetical protein BZA77DRAFT_3532 [Pyronema omphalodes]|nr:hypothetical protein BZA77DRAFT_3532 [Pyronema omphalodes]
MVPQKKQVVVNNPHGTRDVAYNLSDSNDSTTSLDTSGTSSTNAVKSSSKTIAGGPSAWTQQGKFELGKFDEADAKDLESLSQTQRAQLLEQDGERFKAYVKTGFPHGGLPTGGPPATADGYEIIGNKDTVVHNRGQQFKDGRSVDLGPAFGNGKDHTEACRMHSRCSAFLNTCFCEPVVSASGEQNGGS